MNDLMSKIMEANKKYEEAVMRACQLASTDSESLKELVNTISEMHTQNLITLVGEKEKTENKGINIPEFMRKVS